MLSKNNVQILRKDVQTTTAEFEHVTKMYQCNKNELVTCTFMKKLGSFSLTSFPFPSMRHRKALPVCLSTRFIIAHWSLEPITLCVTTAITWPEMLDPRICRNAAFSPTSHRGISLLILDVLPHTPAENLEARAICSVASAICSVRMVSMIVQLIDKWSFHRAYIEHVPLICPPGRHRVQNWIPLSKNK